MGKYTPDDLVEAVQLCATDFIDDLLLNLDRAVSDTQLKECKKELELAAYKINYILNNT